MNLLYYINLFIAVCFIFVPIWWSRRLLQLDWLNPVSLVTICFLPVELFKLLVGQWYIEGLMDPYFQFAVLMTNLQQGIGLLLIYFSARLKVTRQIPYILPKLGFYRKPNFGWISRGFFLLYVVVFLILAIKTGGVSDWLLNIRNSYITKRDGNGIYYAAAINFLSISYFFCGIASDNWRTFTFCSLFYFFAVYILGSKGFLLNFFAFYLIITWRQRQIPISRLLSIALPAIFLLMLVNFFSNSDSIEITSIAQYFEYYPNAAMYYADYFSGALKLFDGQVFLSSFWEYVPRGLFPEKPYVYGILHVVEIYFPGGAESGNTPAFYGGVPQFADFGIIGVLIFAIINLQPLLYFSGLRYTLLEGAFLRAEGLSGRTIIICLLLFSPVFGAFLPIGLIMLMLIFVFGFIKFINVIKNCLKLSIVRYATIK